MNDKQENRPRRRVGRRGGFLVETLEPRALLTASTETFVGPSLTNLFAEAKQGKNTAPAVITKMVTALQSQLISGPLADLNSGAVNSNGFIVEAQALEIRYEQNLVAQKIAGHFPKIEIDQILRLQGQSVVASLIAENQRSEVGLIPGSNLSWTFQSTIKSLTSGPIQGIGTAKSVPASLTKAFRNQLNLLSNDLGNGSLTLDQFNTTLGAEAEAYRGQIHAAIQPSSLAISGRTDNRINILESTVNTIAQAAPTNASSQAASAIKTFVGSVLDTTGIFGPRGAFSKVPANITQHPSANQGQVVSLITGVSGATGSDGTATLTATVNSFNGSPVMGQTVAFTLDGAFAGVAVTNFVGVATLNEVPTTAPVGLDPSGVLARFATNTNFLSSYSTGNLTVNQTSTTISNVSGTGVFGGTDSFQATLTNLATNLPFAGRVVTFSLDGNPIGSAVTDANGRATLSGISSTNSAGTDTSGVVASFAGTTDIAASTAQGNLVITQAGSALAQVSGVAGLGGTATLTATLTSAVTHQGVAGAIVNFTLDGVSVGNAVTSSSGVATLTGVATSDGQGTHAGNVAANFAGNTNYLAATNSSGNLVVSQNNTAVSGVSGVATRGGTASLTATLINSSTSLGITGATISFKLDGVSVGTAVTNSSGVANLTGVATADAVGTVANGVIASFAGTTNDVASSGTGNLVVSPAGTTLNSVSGSAAVGGTATLTATLIAGNTGIPISGETVLFHLDGTSVGSAVTNNAGVATLTGVATSKAAGTDVGGVVANFAGAANYAASTATGNLVVASNPASLASVSGTASFGGTAVLVATFTNATTNQPIAGKTINFTLDGVSAGSAVTNVSGIATLAGVATSRAVGVDTNGVAASFAGDSSAASASATGNLVVSPAATTLGLVSGTANSGGTATLAATLLSSVTSLGIAGQTVDFKLDGTSVGTAVTGTNGVATLTGVATTDAVGTHTGAVVVNYAATTNYGSSQGTGNLIVTGAA